MTHKQLIPSRRTTIVLACLLAAMTIVSGLLLLLEPGPIAPLNVLRLSTLNTDAAAPERALFATDPAPVADRWSAIVVRFSGAARGSAADLDLIDRAQGRGGLAHDFVIGNGQGSGDGRIEVGYRWRQQLDGAHTVGRYEQWFNRNAIGICLIGQGDRTAPTDEQMRQLVWLVQQLQARMNIPADRVVVADGSQVTGSVPRMFPIAQFRQQLLSPAAP